MRTRTDTSGGGGGTPGGLNGEVQFNNAGAFGGTSGASADATNFFLDNAHLGADLDGAGFGIIDLESITGQTGTFLIQTGTTNGDRVTLRAYDVDGAAYTTFAILQAANIPTWTFQQDISMGSHYLTNLLNPVNAQDAATKSFVEQFVNGLSWKQAVEVATLVDIVLSGEQTIDGYATNASRVLVKNQTLPEENGIYVSAAGAWSRSTDMNTSAEFNQATVSVQNGTQMNTAWTQTTNNPVVGTDPIVFVNFLSTVYTASGGLLLTGSDFSLNAKLAPMDLLTGNSLKFLRVNAGETAVEYVTAAALAGITDLTGDVAATGPGSAVAMIQPNAVNFEKSYNGLQLSIVASLRYLTGN